MGGSVTALLQALLFPISHWVGRGWAGVAPAGVQALRSPGLQAGGVRLAFPETQSCRQLSPLCLVDLRAFLSKVPFPPGSSQAGCKAGSVWEVGAPPEREGVIGYSLQPSEGLRTLSLPT